MRKRSARWGARMVLFVAAAALACTAQARMQKVKPGEIPKLDADEGLVVLAIDTDVPVHSLKVLKDGRNFGAGSMRDIPIGRSFQLYIAPAGAYEWREVSLLRNITTSLSDDPEFDFKVEAGSITYAGDLLFRPITFYRSEVAVTNRALASIDWLQQNHPALYDAYPFVFTGHYPDPFPAFYRDARKSHAYAKSATDVKMPPPPAPGALPIAVKTLWKPSQVHDTSLNPSGTLLALQTQVGEEDWLVELIDLQASAVTVLARSVVTYSSVQWAGDRSLLLSRGKPGEVKEISVIRVDGDAAGNRSFRAIALPKEGVVIDPLVDEEDHILFASRETRGELMVHRIDISSQSAADASRTRLKTRLNTGVADDVFWFTDGTGALRLATAVRDEKLVLMHGRDGVFTQVLNLSDDDGFTPVGLSFDGSVIHGLSDKDREQRDLVEFDVSTRRIGRTLFTRPGVDVVSPVYDSRRTPIGATYYQAGRLVTEYFDAADQQRAQLLQDAFPGKTVATVDRSRDGSQLVLWVDAGDQPMQLYHLDVAQRRASLLQDSRPWLEKMTFAPSEVVKFKGDDGLALEAFLTSPKGPGKRPLVVFPHGGPIGVADRLHFDPEVQFLASLGYAVLQVNFRGSEGYGKAFREAGHGNLGTRIEDDIDAAIRHVLARYPVDEQRMCMLGSSYGGYSALVSAARWPDRFRCAVSMSGVSDRALFFTASDGGRTKEGRESLEKVLGNPNTHMAQMQATSPLYNYRDIKVPVMLVHGLEDRRVDFEHTRRMLRMLDMAGNTPVGLELKDEGHGIEDEDNLIKVWEGVAGFLKKYLGEAGGAVASIPEKAL